MYDCEKYSGSKFDGKVIRVDYAESRKREIDEKVGRSVPTAASRDKTESFGRLCLFVANHNSMLDNV
jgi:hypothetical protein